MFIFLKRERPPGKGSLTWGSALGQLAVEPELGDAPIAPHGSGRHFEHFRRLLHAESAKKTHFDNFYLLFWVLLVFVPLPFLLKKPERVATSNVPMVD